MLRLIVAGDTNDQIAAALVVSANTVRHHVTHILNTHILNTTASENRASATAFALRFGLA